MVTELLGWKCDGHNHNKYEGESRAIQNTNRNRKAAPHLKRREKD